MATLTKGRTFVSGETVTPAKLNDLVDLATVTGIVNADIDAAAAIAASKLALTGAITDTQLATGAVTGAAGGGKIAASAITAQTQLADPLASGDEFLVHDASASALRRVAWSALQPVGTVLQTAYNEILGQTSYSGSNVATSVTAPTTSTGHQLFSQAMATSGASNYAIIKVNLSVTSSSGGQVLVMCFAGSTLIAARSLEDGNGFAGSAFIVKYTPPSTASITYSIRAGVRDGYGDLQLNRIYALPSFWNTGKEISSMLIQEIKG